MSWLHDIFMVLSMVAMVTVSGYHGYRYDEHNKAAGPIAGDAAQVGP